jgi:hypothetical protein
MEGSLSLTRAAVALQEANRERARAMAAQWWAKRKPPLVRDGFEVP